VVGDADGAVFARGTECHYRSAQPVTRITGGAVPKATDTRTTVDEGGAVVAEEALVEESLVEEISIDGMCGVY
jgi:mycofactocin precursor peptide MftA